MCSSYYLGPVLAGFMLLIGAEKAISAADTEKLTRGKKIYQQNCIPCHGQKGDGLGPAGKYLKPKPRSFRGDETFKRGGSASDIFTTVSKGLPGTAMAGFPSLSEQDRKAVAAYVVQFAKVNN